jgi:amino acid adenylation domain-containing protein
MFVLQNAPMPALELARLRLALMDVPGETAKFDLTLSLEESSGALSGELEYNSDLFDAATIARMLDHYRRLLESIVSNTGARLADLSLLDEAERRRLLVEWNDTAVGDAHVLCAHQLFERQAERTPEAFAVISESVRLTYGELNRRANRLAHLLRRSGVGPETPVCICLERSVELVVSTVAVVKAGGAYVPLDPSYPAERLDFMLKDSRAPVLITLEKTRGLFGDCGAEVIVLDRDADSIERESAENPAVDVTIENLAYVIYTSGSTGWPKGVEVAHASLMNLVGWCQRAFDATADDRVTLLSGVGFDASVLELWPYLGVGACFHLPDEETRRSPAELRDWLVAHDINVCFTATPVAELLLDMEWPKDAALRLLHTGGDKLHRYPNDSLKFRLINVYGPTENTVVTTSEWVRAEDNDGRPPSIGRPIDNVKVYLLDETLQPVPSGVYGELYVGGAGLARGYLNRPELTAERFIPNPFSASPGARMYRTGDRVRYMPDGRLEFAGRLDYQVKIRGHRIELGEIEAVLDKHPSVRESVVVCREEKPGEKHLASYLVLKEESRPTVDELRVYLSEKLPEHMIPSAFVVLEHLPLNANGKVDRQALPASDAVQLSLGVAYVAPATEMERAVAAVWQELLGLERVGIHDNFFDLGGHSLLIVRMRGMLQEILGRDVAVVELFKFPTVSALAQHLAGRQGPEPADAPTDHRARAEARRESIRGRTRRREKEPIV